MPLEHTLAPELRHVKIHLFGGVLWMLTFFEDLQRHSQLDYFTLAGSVRIIRHTNFPRPVALRQWLALNNSPTFKFCTKLNVDYELGAESVHEELLAEYQRATGLKYSAYLSEIDIRYPEMSFSYPPVAVKRESTPPDLEGGGPAEPIEMEADDVGDDDDRMSSGSEKWSRGEDLDPNAEKVSREAPGNRSIEWIVLCEAGVHRT